MSVTTKSREEILEYLRQVLVELFELKPEQIVPEAHLYNDLDIDSIDAVDLILKLKELTGRKIQPQTFKHVRTVGDVIVEQRVGLVWSGVLMFLDRPFLGFGPGGYAEALSDKGRGQLDEWTRWGRLEPGTPIEKGEPLFPRHQAT